MDQNDKLKQGHFEIQDSFIIMLIDRDAVTKVTTLNRIMSQRVLVFMGNGLGVISYGRGKGLTPDAALSNAIRHAKQNLIAIPIDYKVSVP
jgi:ribosomal protein S5